jgi:hypothetical protein
MLAAPSLAAAFVDVARAGEFPESCGTAVGAPLTEPVFVT